MRVEHFIESPAFMAQRAALLSDDEFAALTTRLATHPDAGVALGGNVFKIRVGLAGRGRRGGARVVYGWRRADGVIVFLACYAKNEAATLSPAGLAALQAIFREE